MRQLFLPPEQFDGDAAHITGQDHIHLTRVMRARPGDPLLLLDNRGNAFRAVLVKLAEAETSARIVERVEINTEPPLLMSVAQALGKGDKFEQVIQHGTEIGASAFVPIRADHSVADVPAGRLADRLARWRKIARSAAEQAGRARIPTVSAPLDLEGLLRCPEADQMRILLQPDGPGVQRLHEVLSGWREPRPVLLAVGPEGGWSAAEIALARAKNMVIAALGPRVLRTETAALVAISQVLYQFEWRS